MKANKATWAIAASFVASTALASGPIDLDPAGWVPLAEGVYQREDADGTVTRLAFDAGGARYDRSVLEQEIGRLSSAASRSDVGAEAELAELNAALAGIPAVGPTHRTGTPPVSITSSQTGALCGHWAYAFDSHLSVGRIGATVTARTGVGSDLFGPPPPVSSATQYARAVLTPAGGTAITTTHTLPDLSTWMAPSTSDWIADDAANSPLTPSSCTASTFSYISVTAGTTCTPSSGGYASMTKNYTTCVTTP